VMHIRGVLPLAAVVCSKEYKRVYVLVEDSPEATIFPDSEVTSGNYHAEPYRYLTGQEITDRNQPTRLNWWQCCWRPISARSMVMSTSNTPSNLQRLDLITRRETGYQYPRQSNTLSGNINLNYQICRCTG
jgi:hypothetical protein